MFGIPKFLPLLFFSDHGTLTGGIVDKQILDVAQNGDFYFSFSKSVCENQKEYPLIRIIGVLHPWVYFRRKHGIIRNFNSENILYFPMHSAPGYKIEGFNDQASIDFLKNLELKSSNIFICLYWFDYVGDRRKKYDEAGFNVITLGHPEDPEFVINFYKVAKQTRYAISEGWTSAVAYLTDLEVPCTVIPRDMSVVHTEDPDRILGMRHEGYSIEIRQAQELFSKFPPQVTSEQRKFVGQQLGYEYEDNHLVTQALVRKLYLTRLIPWLTLKISNILKRQLLLAWRRK
jgi:hypothetical protein